MDSKNLNNLILQDHHQQHQPYHSSSSSEKQKHQDPLLNHNQNTDEENQFLDITSNTNSKHMNLTKMRDSIRNVNENKLQNANEPNQDPPEFQECHIHKKPLDILCLIEKIMICSSCALFGDHKGHQFKNSDDIEKELLERQQLILSLVQKKLNFDKNKQPQARMDIVQNILLNKKQQIISKVSSQAEKLIRQIKQCQQNCFIQLQQQFETLTAKYQGSYTKLLEAQKQYATWQQQAFNEVEHLLKCQTLEQKVKGLNFAILQPQIPRKGRLHLTILQGIFQDLQKQKNRCLNSVEVILDTSVINKLKKFAAIQTIQKRQLCLLRNIEITNKNNLSISILQNTEEHLISQENNQNLKSQISVFSLETSMRSLGKSPLCRSSIAFSPRMQRMLRQDMKSGTKNRLKSPTKPQTPLQIARYKRTKLKLPQKYDKIMEEVLADTCEVFDLTNGQLGNQVTLKMLQLLRTNNKVRTVKLSQNRLTDDIIQHLWKNLYKIQTLNLSNNFFTQKLLDSFMGNLSLIPSLRNLVLTQNKIIARSLKAKVEQLKQIGILVTL